MQSVLAVLSALTFLGCKAQSRLFHESCQDDSDCDQRFKCVKAVCDCEADYVISSAHDLCLAAAEYGKKCRETSQCLLKLANTTCGASDKCECSRGYGFDTTKQDCSTIVNAAVAHRGKCILDQQCKSLMVCANQICDCKDDLRWDRATKTCRPRFGSVPYGESCEVDQECKSELGLVCVRDVCQCKPKLRYDTAAGSCVPDFGTVQYGGQCRLKEDCVDGLVCVGSLCGCTSTQHWDATANKCNNNQVNGSPPAALSATILVLTIAFSLVY